MEKNKSYTGWIILAAIVGVLFIFGSYVTGTYNTAVEKDVSVEKLFGNVQTAYQRRVDLIPNLVETVKGAKNFEQETLVQIAEMRSQAGQAQINVQSAKDVAELQAAGTQMSGVLSRLMVIVEAYPDLKSNQNFLSLQDEIAGTENRVKYERDNYNEGVRDYQTFVRKFPANIITNMFGFSSGKWSMFEAEQGSEKAPKIDFSDK